MQISRCVFKNHQYNEVETRLKYNYDNISALQYIPKFFSRENFVFSTRPSWLYTYAT